MNFNEIVYITFNLHHVFVNIVFCIKDLTSKILSDYLYYAFESYCMSNLKINWKQTSEWILKFLSQEKVSSSTVTSTSTLSIVPPSAGGMLREIIVRPPAPKSLRNKSASCKPIMQTKGVCVKSQTCHKAVQTGKYKPFSLFPKVFYKYVNIYSLHRVHYGNQKGNSTILSKRVCFILFELFIILKWELFRII